MLPMLLAMLEDEEDQRKFLKLHSAYEKKLYRIALQILRSQTLAEDAVQQSWLQIIQHFEEIKKIPWDGIEGYVVVVAKNVSLTMLKKERRTDPLPEDWDAPAPEAPPLDETTRLIALIRSMPKKYREVLELRFALEYSYQEIVRRTRMNPSTVSTLISRGRQLLIKKLNQEGYCHE
ncbi:sigma-70 family RNA polymerase sigma factor [Oscillibacter sp.]|uniref:RNA polymerase sigma factor n=1 Tax=Oscillibacter sp. TaxID=1945593 RepID=UPI002615F055|nr:sigma-70 family RNA polymerase sigma factor [Oscillibacter sp.]MDD3346882.1 sigma-70 family RNA polymerase sigma factor [Oscillibacter sp.]